MVEKVKNNIETVQYKKRKQIWARYGTESAVQSDIGDCTQTSDRYFYCGTLWEIIPIKMEEGKAYANFEARRLKRIQDEKKNEPGKRKWKDQLAVAIESG